MKKAVSKRKIQIGALEVFDVAYEQQTNDIIDDLDVKSTKTSRVESSTARNGLDKIDADSVKSTNAFKTNRSECGLDNSLVSSLQDQYNGKDAVNLEGQHCIPSHHGNHQRITNLQRYMQGIRQSYLARALRDFCQETRSACAPTRGFCLPADAHDGECPRRTASVASTHLHKIQRDGTLQPELHPYSGGQFVNSFPLLPVLHKLQLHYFDPSK